MEFIEFICWRNLLWGMRDDERVVKYSEMEWVDGPGVFMDGDGRLFDGAHRFMAWYIRGRDVDARVYVLRKNNGLVWEIFHE